MVTTDSSKSAIKSFSSTAVATTTRKATSFVTTLKIYNFLKADAHLVAAGIAAVNKADKMVYGWFPFIAGFIVASAVLAPFVWHYVSTAPEEEANSKACLSKMDPSAFDSILSGCTWIINNRPMSAASAYNVRGTLHYMKKECDLAVDDFNKALNINKKNPTYFSNRGYAYFVCANEPALAITDFTQALQLDPSNASALAGIRLISKAMLADAHQPKSPPVCLPPSSPHASRNLGPN